jgi:hypothetical protein
VQTVRVYGGVEAQFHLPLTVTPDRVSGHLHATASLPKRKENSVPFELEAGWAPSRYGWVG